MLKNGEPYRSGEPKATAAKLSRLRVRATGEKRKGGNPKGQPRPKAYGTGICRPCGDRLSGYFLPHNPRIALSTLSRLNPTASGGSAETHRKARLPIMIRWCPRDFNSPVSVSNKHSGSLRSNKPPRGSISLESNRNLPSQLHSPASLNSPGTRTDIRSSGQDQIETSPLDRQIEIFAQESGAETSWPGITDSLGRSSGDCKTTLPSSE